MDTSDGQRGVLILGGRYEYMVTKENDDISEPISESVSEPIIKRESNEGTSNHTENIQTEELTKSEEIDNVEAESMTLQDSSEEKYMTLEEVAESRGYASKEYISIKE